MAEIRDHFIGIGIFAIIIICAITIIININSGDPAGDKSDAIPGFMDEAQLQDFNESINVADELKEDTAALHESVKKLTPKLDVTSIITLPIAFVQTGWNLVKFMINAFELLTTPLTTFSSFLGIPPFVIDLVIAILTLVLIFAVVGLIFGKDF